MKYYFYLNFFVSKSGCGALLDVGRQILMNVFEDQVEGHLAITSVTVGDVQKSGERRSYASF